jgi:hypothetical protein
LDKRDIGRVGVILLLAGIIYFNLPGCASSKGSYTPRKHMKYYRETYHPSVQRADDIQYRSAYKYDIKGKKYKRYFKKQEKRNKKK